MVIHGQPQSPDAIQARGAIIVAHNHPSGIPEPGTADLDWTLKLRRACDLMDIDLLDYVLLTKDKFFSFESEKAFNYSWNN